MCSSASNSPRLALQIAPPQRHSVAAYAAAASDASAPLMQWREQFDAMAREQRNALLIEAGRTKSPTAAWAAAATIAGRAVNAVTAVAACDAATLVSLMHQLGQLNVSEADAVSLRDVLDEELASAAGSQRLPLADAVAAAAASRLANFKEQFGVLHLDAAAHVREHSGRLKDMWLELYARYRPSELPPVPERKGIRVLIIGPGYGMLVNPLQTAVIEQAGFVVQKCFPPNPEEANFVMATACDLLEAHMRKFQPHAITCASKGGAYVAELWRRMERAGGKLHGWEGATVMINAHPDCTALPEDAPVVIAHGGADKMFPFNRTALEALLKDRHRSAFLYLTNGGGSPARPKDGHDMATLLRSDCLPRLLDAVTVARHGSMLSPEFNIACSWVEFLSEERRAAEEFLGFKPDQLSQKWVTDGQSNQPLMGVDAGSEEYAAVQKVFLSEPVVPAHYQPTFVGCTWSERAQVLSIQRVENFGQEGLTNTTYRNVNTGLKREGIKFRGGVHSRWLFHGTDYETIVKIACNPASGFTALAAAAAHDKLDLWGPGIYFARDAHYPDTFGFSNPSGSDGTKHVMLCLVVTGTSCLGGLTEKLHLKRRDNHSTYDSFVDSLSDPEIFVVADGAHVCPAYVIQYRT